SSERSHVLRPKLLGSVPAHGRAGRQDSAGYKARRYSSRAAIQIRACHQSHDCEGTRPDHSGVVPAARRRGDRIACSLLRLLTALAQSGHTRPVGRCLLSGANRKTFTRLSLPLLNPKPTTEVKATMKTARLWRGILPSTHLA